MSVISIDLGTTSICGMRMSRNKETELVRKYQNHMTDEAICSQDPEAILACARRLAEELMDSSVTDVVISSQMHGILFLNKAGEAVSEFYTWKNPWGQELCGELTYAEKLGRLTGKQCSSGYGLVTCAYLKDHQALPEEAAWICNIGDYIAMRLAGSRIPVMNVTIAESIGGYDAVQKDFDRDLIDRIGLDRHWFPAVMTKDYTYGNYCQAAVHAAFGDNQCSFLGSVQDYRTGVCINVGTGEQVSCYSEYAGALPEGSAGGGIQLRSFFDLGYLYVAVSKNGGKVYERLMQLIGAVIRSYTGLEVDVYKRTAELLQQEAGGEGAQEQSSAASTQSGKALQEHHGRLSITPAIYDMAGGVREGCLLLEGIEAETGTVTDLLTAYVEGMARELADLYGRIPAGIREERTRFYASGNGIVKNVLLWRQVETLLSCSLHQEIREEAAAAGAAMYIMLMREER